MSKNTEQSLVDYLESHGPAGPSQIAAVLNISQQMVHRYLKKLLAAKIISKSGIPPQVRYQVIQPKLHTETDKYYQFTLSPVLEKCLDQIEQRQLKIEQIQDPSLRAVIQKKLKIDWTYESNAIEGSTLSHGETLFFIEQGLTVEGKPFKDFLDAKNHVQAIELVFEIIKEKRAITENLIKEINALLLFGIKETPALTTQGKRIKKTATPGTYKKMPNHVLQLDGSIHKYVEPMQVATQMARLCQWIAEQENQGVSPVIISSIAHYNFVRIHPFDDGNGRGARILMNLILMRHGIVPAIVRNEERRKYFQLLSEADKGSLMPFILFIAEQVSKTQENIIQVIGT